MNLPQHTPFTFVVHADGFVDGNTTTDPNSPTQTGGTGDDPTLPVQLQSIPQQQQTSSVIFNVSSSNASVPIPDNTTVTITLTDLPQASAQGVAANGIASVTVSALPPGAPFKYTVSADGFVTSPQVSDQTGAAGSSKNLPVSLTPAPVTYTFLTGENSPGQSGTVTMPVTADITVSLLDGTLVSPKGFATSSNGLVTSFDIATLSLIPGTTYNFTATETGGQGQRVMNSFTPKLAGQGNNRTTIVFGPGGTITSDTVTKVSNKGNPQSSTPNAQPTQGIPIKALPPPSR
jgi:hypothetical protein